MLIPHRFIIINTLFHTVKALIVDCLASGKGVRLSTRDVIGSGPRTIAGVLEKRGIAIKILPVESLLGDADSLNQYDLLLVSGMTSDISAIQKTLKIWRSIKNNPAIIGGPAASEPVRVLRKTNADISVTGEGESTLSELLGTELSKGKMPKAEDLHKIKGIAYKAGSRVKVNPFRPVQGKDTLYRSPPSTQRITDYPLFYAARVYVEVLRGCSNYHRSRIGPLHENCTYCEKCTEGSLEERYNCPAGIPPGCGYCSVPSLYGPPRSKPVHLVVEEVEKLLRLGVTRIVLSAPGFLDYGRDLLVEPEPLTDPRSPEPNYAVIEDLLMKLTSLPKMIEGDASIMVENIKAALVTETASRILGKYLRGTPINVGFETGDPEHSRSLGRPSSPSENLRAIRLLSKAGLRPYVYFIHGLPGQTESTVNATVEMINKSVELGACRIILYRFQSLPMTAFMGCPSGPPSALSDQGRRIHEAARKANESVKESLVGSRIKVVVAEQYSRDRNYLVAYPLRHGPVVLIEGDMKIVGDIVEIKVTEIASDRMIHGQVCI